MADEDRINAAVVECLAAIARSSDPQATINEFCAALAKHKYWNYADVAIVQLRVRRTLYAPT